MLRVEGLCRLGSCVLVHFWSGRKTEKLRWKTRRTRLPTESVGLDFSARPSRRALEVITSHGANKPEMAKRLIPLLDRVLVEKIVAPTKSVGGILLPESAVSKVRDDSDASTPFPTRSAPPRPTTDPYSLPHETIRSTRRRWWPWARAGARARTASSSPWVRKATATTVDRRAFFSPSEPFHLSQILTSVPLPHTSQASRLATLCSSRTTEVRPWTSGRTARARTRRRSCTATRRSWASSNRISGSSR